MSWRRYPLEPNNSNKLLHQGMIERLKMNLKNLMKRRIILIIMQIIPATSKLMAKVVMMMTMKKTNKA